MCCNIVVVCFWLDTNRHHILVYMIHINIHTYMAFIKCMYYFNLSMFSCGCYFVHILCIILYMGCTVESSCSVTNEDWREKKNKIEPNVSKSYRRLSKWRFNDFHNIFFSLNGQQEKVGPFWRHQANTMLGADRERNYWKLAFSENTPTIIISN